MYPRMLLYALNVAEGIPKKVRMVVYSKGGQCSYSNYNNKKNPNYENMLFMVCLLYHVVGL